MAKTAPEATAAERLHRYCRVNFNWAHEMAAALDTTDGHLSQILAGKRRPGLALAIRIEEQTGIPIRLWLPAPVPRVKRTRRRKTRQPAAQVA